MFSEVPEGSNPLLILGFIRNFSSLAMFSFFPSLDFSQTESKTLKEIETKFENKTILTISSEIRAVCGEKNIKIDEPRVAITKCRSGFGKLISQPYNSEAEADYELPTKKQTLNKLQLAPRFLQHLILN